MMPRRSTTALIASAVLLHSLAQEFLQSPFRSTPTKATTPSAELQMSCSMPDIPTPPTMNKMSWYTEEASVMCDLLQYCVPRWLTSTYTLEKHWANTVTTFDINLSSFKTYCFRSFHWTLPAFPCNLQLATSIDGEWFQTLDSTLEDLSTSAQSEYPAGNTAAVRSSSGRSTVPVV